MRFNKEFREWFKKEFKFDIPDKWLSWYTFDMDTLYNAFKAHDEELDRLRKFEKEVRKLQKKCNKYGEKSSDCWSSNRDKSVEYEMKYDEALEEFLYLQKRWKQNETTN